MSACRIRCASPFCRRPRSSSTRTCTRASRRCPIIEVRVEVVLPCRPVQIAVDPDQVLVDRDPTNNYWKTPVRWRFSPVFTLLDEADLTTAYDCWNVTFGPWLYGAAYNDAWYKRATIVGAPPRRLPHAGVQRRRLRRLSHQLPRFRGRRRRPVGPLALGPHADRLQRRAARRHPASTADAQPNREVLFARYVFQYNSSLYLPPIHFLETFLTRQDNFLPLSRTFVPGQQRYEDETLAGLHYHLELPDALLGPAGGHGPRPGLRGRQREAGQERCSQTRSPASFRR